MPYSDPLADGPTIQASSKVALEHGITIPKIMKLLHSVKNKIHVPIVLMGYFNPVMQYGIEAFCNDAAEAGVSGVIIPDLPDSYYERYCKMHFDAANIKPVHLITPLTADERIRSIDDKSGGFIYAVSSASTTGSAHKSGVNVNFLTRLEQLQLKTPILVGFNVKTAEDHRRNSAQVQGSIIGSAFIRAITDVADPVIAARQFVQNIKKGL